MQGRNENNSKKLLLAISKIIKKYRLKTGKSIYAISAECGIPKSTWQDIENNTNNNIKLTTLWKIAEGLEVALTQIIEEVKYELGSDFTLLDEVL